MLPLYGVVGGEGGGGEYHGMVSVVGGLEIVAGVVGGVGGVGGRVSSPPMIGGVIGPNGLMMSGSRMVVGGGLGGGASSLIVNTSIPHSLIPIASPIQAPISPRSNVELISTGSNGEQAFLVNGVHLVKEGTFEFELRKLLKYSFSNTLNNDDLFFLQLLNSAEIIKSIMTKDFMVDSAINSNKTRMDTILKAVAKIIGIDYSKKRGNKIDRKKDEKLSSIEATVILIFKMNDKFMNDVYYDRAAFDSKYCSRPEFLSVGPVELNNLFHYCNCVRAILRFVPPTNNKEHILDLATRIEEGYSVKRVTGTGMTPDTRRRYAFIHTESGIEPQARGQQSPRVANLFLEHHYERRQDLTEYSPHLANKKGRGRPRKVRDDDESSPTNASAYDETSPTNASAYDEYNANAGSQSDVFRSLTNAYDDYDANASGSDAFRSLIDDFRKNGDSLHLSQQHSLGDDATITYFQSTPNELSPALSSAGGLHTRKKMKTGNGLIMGDQPISSGGLSSISRSSLSPRMAIAAVERHRQGDDFERRGFYDTVSEVATNQDDINRRFE